MSTELLASVSELTASTTALQETILGTKQSWDVKQTEWELLLNNSTTDSEAFRADMEAAVERLEEKILPVAHRFDVGSDEYPTLKDVTDYLQKILPLGSINIYFPAGTHDCSGAEFNGINSRSKITVIGTGVTSCTLITHSLRVENSYVHFQDVKFLAKTTHSSYGIDVHGSISRLSIQAGRVHFENYSRAVSVENSADYICLSGATIINNSHYGIKINRANYVIADSVVFAGVTANAGAALYVTHCTYLQTNGWTIEKALNGAAIHHVKHGSMNSWTLTKIRHVLVATHCPLLTMTALNATWLSNAAGNVVNLTHCGKFSIAGQAADFAGIVISATLCAEIYANGFKTTNCGSAISAAKCFYIKADSLNLTGRGSGNAVYVLHCQYVQCNSMTCAQYTTAMKANSCRKVLFNSGNVTYTNQLFSSLHSDYIEIKSHQFSGKSGTHAAYITDAKKVDLNASNLVCKTSYGVTIDRCVYVVATGLKISECTTDGFSVRSTAQVAWTGSTIENFGRYGVYFERVGYVAGASSNKITGRSSNAGGGLWLRDIKYFHSLRGTTIKDVATGINAERIERGTYWDAGLTFDNVKSPLYLRQCGHISGSGIKFLGAGGGVLIDAKDCDRIELPSSIEISHFAKLFEITNVNWLDFYNSQLTENVNTLGNALESSQVRLDKMVLDGMGTHGMYAKNRSMISAQNCTFTNTTYDLFNALDRSVIYANNTDVDGCRYMATADRYSEIHTTGLTFANVARDYSPAALNTLGNNNSIIYG